VVFQVLTLILVGYQCFGGTLRATSGRYLSTRPYGVISHKIIIRGKGSSGSKTAVMDVIGFLCVLLGTSTVQLHDSLGSRRSWACSEAGFSSQNGDRA
jgi:hypothetical protein